MKNLENQNKRVILRVDYNVPILDDKIIDTSRIIKTLETINYLLKLGLKIIILSHRGRVKNSGDKEKYSLKLIGEYLSDILNLDVLFIPYTSGRKIKEILNTRDHRIYLIENTRFEDIEGNKESNNNQELAEYWSSLGDYFVFDAFGASHRDHASTIGIAKKLPTFSGKLVEKELEALDKISNNISDVELIIGGSKVSDKITILKYLLDKVSKVYIGGAMAFTFLKALNLEIGKSLFEEDYVSFAKDVIQTYESKIVLPIDVKVVKDIDNPLTLKEKSVYDFNEDDIGIDIGSKTVSNFIDKLRNAKLIVWNGPMGVYEVEEYSKGSVELCKYLSKLENIRIVGGGDSAAICNKLNVNEKFTHISTGGGAFLKSLSGEKIKIIELLKSNPKKLIDHLV